MNIKVGIHETISLLSGQTIHEAVEASIAYAQVAERNGVQRFWLAEHHVNRCHVSMSPEVLIPLYARQTQTMRIGSGGVMIANYSAFKVAETFKLLDCLFPNRIDLGIGFGHGADADTIPLLAGPGVEVSSFEKFLKVQFYLNQLGDRAPFVGQSMRSASSVPIWCLSTGGESSEFAARYGHNLALAQFIKPSMDLKTCIDQYRANKGRSISVCFGAILGHSSSIERQIQHHALNRYLSDSQSTLPYPGKAVRLGKVLPGLSRYIEQISRSCFIGEPRATAQRLHEYASNLGCDEIMLHIIADCPEEKNRNLSLFMESWQEAAS